MKISPLILFLILLIFLVLSIVIGKNNKYLRETFISYQQSATTNASVTVLTYSPNAVSKIYDNLYFDNKNGNIIEIDSPTYKSSSSNTGSCSSTTTTSNDKDKDNIDLIGKTITSTTVTPRVNNGISYQYTSGNTSVQQTVTESKISSTSISYSSFIYNTLSENTDKYSVLYIPWNIDTYVHIIDKSTKSHIETFGSIAGSINYTNLNNLKISFTSPSTGEDANNNTFVTEQYYDSTKILYQVSKYVKMNIANGNLIVQLSNTPRSVAVYQRDKLSSPTIVKNINDAMNLKVGTSVNSIPFTSAVIPDPLGNNDILYVANGSNTLVAIISLASDGINYTLSNVVRFTANAIDNGSNISNQSNLVALFNQYLMNSGINPNNYYSQFEHQYGRNPYDPSKNPSDYSANRYSDDYILKTQIVPPVCPSCATCPNCTSSSGGICTNCGGHGGSGTLSQNGSTTVTGDKNNSFYNEMTKEHTLLGEGTPTTGKKDASGKDIEWKSEIGKGTFSSNADPNTLAGGLTLMQYSTVAGVEELGYTAGDVAKTGINAVGGVVKDVTGGVGSVAKGGADIIKGAGSGAVDLAKSAGSGFMELTREQRQNQGMQGINIGAGSGVGAGAGTGTLMGGPAGGIGGMQYGASGISTKGPQSMSPSSFYGPVSQSASNYMPVTADFSSFRH